MEEEGGGAAVSSSPGGGGVVLPLETGTRCGGAVLRGKEEGVLGT